MILLPVVAAQLGRLGVETETGMVENPNDVAAEEDFDLFLWAQPTAPSGDPAFFFNSMLATGAALTFAHYASPAFDAIVAKFAGTADPAERAGLAEAAQAQLFEDAPRDLPRRDRLARRPLAPAEGLRPLGVESPRHPRRHEQDPLTRPPARRAVAPFGPPVSHSPLSGPASGKPPACWRSRCSPSSSSPPCPPIR